MSKSQNKNILELVSARQFFSYFALEYNQLV